MRQAVETNEQPSIRSFFEMQLLIFNGAIDGAGADFGKRGSPLCRNQANLGGARLAPLLGNHLRFVYYPKLFCGHCDMSSLAFYQGVSVGLDKFIQSALAWFISIFSVTMHSF